MSCIVHRQPALAPRRKSLRDRFRRLAHRLRIYRERRRQHQELCNFLASDHRAAADIGITSCEARRLLHLPFWRP